MLDSKVGRWTDLGWKRWYRIFCSWRPICPPSRWPLFSYRVRQAMVSEYSGTSADTVLMSPHLWFHLRRQPSPLVCPNARLRLVSALLMHMTLTFPLFGSIVILVVTLDNKANT